MVLGQVQLEVPLVQACIVQYCGVAAAMHGITEHSEAARHPGSSATRLQGHKATRHKGTKASTSLQQSADTAISKRATTTNNDAIAWCGRQRRMLAESKFVENGFIDESHSQFLLLLHQSRRFCLLPATLPLNRRWRKARHWSAPTARVLLGSRYPLLADSAS